MTPPTGPLFWLFSTMANNLGRAGDLLVSVPPGGSAPIKAQLRIASMSGNMLDLAATDFYGAGLPRRPQEPDASYRARIVAGLFIKRITRPNVFAFLKNLAGVAPRLTEVMRPGDLGGYADTRTRWSAPVGGHYAPPSGMAVVAYGVDTSAAPFRWTHGQGGLTTPPASAPIPTVQTLPAKSQAFTSYVETAIPYGYGAQGNPAQGWASSVASDYGTPSGGKYASYKLGATSGYGGATASAWGTPTLNAELQYIYPAFAAGPGFAYFGGWGTPQNGKFTLIEGMLALLNQLAPMVAVGIRCLVGFRAAEDIGAGDWKAPCTSGSDNWAS